MRSDSRFLPAFAASVLLFAACTSTAQEATVSDTVSGIGNGASAADSIDATDAELNEPIDPNPDNTPIELNPAVRTGTLDNGLTYFILENDSPGQRAEIRLAINAGSSQQKVADSGSAHFLEHMLFNGTEAYPNNKLDDLLRGLGMEIGPDINAYTSFDETVYELSLPDVEPATIDQGLKVIAEWAGSALIDENEVVAERGVVREEHRLRAQSVDGVINAQFTDVYTADTGYEGRDPIGTEDQILATKSAELRQFYDDWYRPDNMAVIVVGDFSAPSVERRVEEALGGLESRGSNADREQISAPVSLNPVVEVFTHPDGPEPSLSLDFVLPHWQPGTVGGERLLLADEVIAIMLQNYLDEAAANGTLSLIRPFVGTFELARERRFLGMNVAADDLEMATSDILRAIKSVQITGFTEDQIGQAAQQLQAGIDQINAGADTQQDYELASELVAHFLSGHAFQDGQTWHERLSGEIASFSAAELNNLFRWEMAHTAPILVAIGSNPGSLPTVDQLEAALDAADGAIAFDAVEAVAIDELMATPEGVNPIDTGAVPGGEGAVWWEFDNGATVIHQRSTIASGTVMMWAIAEGGRVLLSEEHAAVADVALDTVSRSGIGTYNDVTVSRFLADTSASLGPFLTTTTEGFTGQADAQDVAVLFQLLALYTTQPRVDDIGLAEAKNSVESQLRQIETDPGLASLYASLDARFGTDSRYIGVPTLDQVKAMTTDDALAIYKERFAGIDDLVVIVVGDVAASDVEVLAANFVGTIPSRPSDGDIPEIPALPSGPVVRSVSAGTNDSGAGFDLSYSLVGSLSRSEQVTGDYLVSIINGRLFDRVREELGASYGGGSAGILTGSLADGETSLSVSVDGDPERLGEIRAVVQDELDRLATQGPDTVDFAEAKSIVKADADLVSNFNLLLGLSEWAVDRSNSAYSRSDYAADATKVTAAKVQALAAKLISDANLVEIKREPS